MGLAMDDSPATWDPLDRFQFPFHRDGPCDLSLSEPYSESNTSFSSLFIGMGLAMQGQKGVTYAEAALSVPFSSGWALRYSDGTIKIVAPTSFSSLFIGMGLAMAFKKGRIGLNLALE